MGLSPEQNLSAAEAETFARGLYAIARCDGVHEREAALIASFWADTGGGPQALAELARRDSITAKELADHLADAETRSLFIKTAILLGWADGNFSDGERKLVAEFAKALSVSDIPTLEAQVKEYLLSHLTHLQNSASAAAVAKKLSI
jgi:tellurite resistance protein